MATLGDGFKGIFLAGIGAVAIGAEKGKRSWSISWLRGEMTVEQGKQINTELKHRASNLESSIRRDTIEARMSMMSPDERVEFANIVREMADTANAKDAEAAAEKLKAANAASTSGTAAESNPIAEAKTACATAVAAVGTAVEAVANSARSVLDEAAALNAQRDAASAETPAAEVVAGEVVAEPAAGAAAEPAADAGEAPEGEGAPRPSAPPPRFVWPKTTHCSGHFFAPGADADPEGRFGLNSKSRRRRMREIVGIVGKHRALEGFTPEEFRAMLEDLGRAS